MYCSKCGREIDYDSPMCLECTAMLAMQAKASREAARVQIGSAPEVTPTPVAPTVSAAPEIQTAEQASPIAETASPVNEPAFSVECGDISQSESALAVDLAPEVKETSVPKKNTRNEGLKRAIIGCSMGWANILVVLMGVFSLIYGGISIGILPGVFVAFTVMALIFSIQSIKTFRRVRKEGNPAPIATLIVGLHGLWFVVFTVIYALFWIVWFIIMGSLGIVNNIFDYSYLMY